MLPGADKAAGSLKVARGHEAGLQRRIRDSRRGRGESYSTSEWPAPSREAVRAAGTIWEPCLCWQSKFQPQQSHVWCWLQTQRLLTAATGGAVARDVSTRCPRRSNWPGGSVTPFLAPSPVPLPRQHSHGLGIVLAWYQWHHFIRNRRHGCRRCCLWFRRRGRWGCT